MRKAIIYFLFTIMVVSFISCARGITVDEAANGKAKCGRHLR